MKIKAKLSLTLKAAEGKKLEICKEAARREEIEEKISDMYSIPKENIKVIENPSTCHKRYVCVEITFDNDSTTMAALERVQYLFRDCRPVERKIEFKRTDK